MKKSLEIISWNVNGIRACYRKGCWEWVKKRAPYIICLQETKATTEQIPPEIISKQGHNCYFDSPLEKKGYSGVGILSQAAPERTEKGIGVPSLDNEGRSLTLHFKDFTLINTYFPNGGGGPVRLAYKLKYYDAFLQYVEKLRRKQKNVLFCGDINTAHNEIDLARPKENEKNTGFLPEERAWLDKLISKGYIDVFRKQNPSLTDAYTYWDMKIFARQRNVGWRIDYFFA
ncbi:MAG: exodeoxyribonuclease III, partial [Patescibacteria group bacterium]